MLVKFRSSRRQQGQIVVYVDDISSIWFVLIGASVSCVLFSACIVFPTFCSRQLSLRRTCQSSAKDVSFKLGFVAQRRRAVAKQMRKRSATYASSCCALMFSCPSFFISHLVMLDIVLLVFIVVCFSFLIVSFFILY